MDRARRRAIALALALAAPFVAPGANAEAYPARPVRIIVGFIPGSSADITARVLGQRMGQILGQQFVIENKPGAGSSLAAEFVARAPKDGYTLFLGSSANITNAAINPNLSFDLAKDFAPIALVTTAAVILVVHPSTGVNSVQELIALARSKPGEVFYASTGVGTAPHLSGELFAMRSGVKLVHVPYQGSPQAVTDLLAGRTSMMFSPVSAVVSQVETGKLKALAPAGTPREIVDKLARATREALQSEDVLAALHPQGFDALSGGPEVFASIIQSEIKRWGEVAQAAGLKK